MPTVLFYSYILLLSTFFVYFSENGKGRIDKYTFIIIAFLLVFIPSAIRYDVGTDYFNYIDIYNNIESETRLELGFYYINLFLKVLDAHSQWSIAVFAFMFSFFCFKGYPEKHGWVVHFVLMCLVYFLSFNGIRQAVAIALCFWSIRLFLDNKLFLFLLVSLAGALFHKTAVVFTLIGLLSFIPVHDVIKRIYAPILVVISLFVFYFKSSEVFVFLESVLRFLGMNYYAGYFSDKTHFVATELGTGIGVLSQLFFSVFFLINTKYILELNKRNWILILLVSAYALSLILSAQIVLFSRLAFVFIVALPYAVYILLRLDIHKKLNYSVVLFFVFILFLSFFKNSFSFPSSYGDSKINPYRTVISEHQ